MRYQALITLSAALWMSSPVLAEETSIPMQAVDAHGQQDAIGSVVVTETPYGLVFTPRLEGLAPGIHGFHVHENPSCEPADQNGKAVAAGVAGGHLDPEKTGEHDFPWGNGHLGDLPALYVDENGHADNPVLAPRLKKLADIANRSLMVHQGGDNHADHPKPLGGGGDRVACGVIPPEMGAGR